MKRILKGFALGHSYSVGLADFLDRLERFYAKEYEQGVSVPEGVTDAIENGLSEADVIKTAIGCYWGLAVDADLLLEGENTYAEHYINNGEEDYRAHMKKNGEFDYEGYLESIGARGVK